MKKITALLAGLLTIVSNNPVSAQQKNDNKDKSLLWRINGKNLSRPSYLFGTIHLICAKDFLWTGKMQESFNKSDKICFEMDLDDAGAMMRASMGLMENGGKKLKEYFTDDQYRILEKYVHDSLGMDIGMFEQMKPVALLSMIGTSGVSCENAVSYEDSIMQIAQAGNKEIWGLEDPKEQLDALATLPIDTVIKQIIDAIQNNVSDEKEFNELISAYKAQDLPALYKLLNNSKELKDDLAVFLDDRNKKWIPRMTDKMNTNSVFFAVGAGHLYGPNGVIALLRKDGYTVEPEK
jgi:uncharacterized protein YbaP (TraB family)